MSNQTTIHRSDLIAKGEQFLNREITALGLEVYAGELMSQDHFDWDDAVISDIVFQWDNPDINFPITRRNIELWKHQLVTGENLLADHNLWSVHIDRQKEICRRYDSIWKPINKNLRIGLGSDIMSNPVHGLRHPEERGTTGWFIWTGEFSEKEDFFEPMCAEHLLQIRPELIKYLGLDIGYRFSIDEDGSEDVWYDEKLKRIE